MTGDFDLGLFFCVEGGATMKKRWGGNRGLEERMGRERSKRASMRAPTTSYDLFQQVMSPE